MVCGLLAIVDSLEKRGYELELSDALEIMQLFGYYGFFKQSVAIEKCLYSDKEFENEAKEIMLSPSVRLYDQYVGNYDDNNEDNNEEEEITSEAGKSLGSLSLFNLILLRPEEALKRLTYKDYFDFARSLQLF
uniref:Uncharacterized protein n=1 Tax=Trichogramma kaykai TaxID=54128 RepID=A0ABD2XFE4_9HYME